MVPPPGVDSGGRRQPSLVAGGLPRWLRRPVDAQATRDVGLVLGLGLALSGVYALSGRLHVGLPCLLKLTTGWDCPLCGATRMGAAMLRGDLLAAWYFNPVVLVGGAGLGTWFVGALLYQAGWLRRPMPRPRGIAGRVVLGALLCVLVVFTIGRNLPVGPLAAFRV
jgi:Protein of unknown function (DUF2752)